MDQYGDKVSEAGKNIDVQFLSGTDVLGVVTLAISNDKAETASLKGNVEGTGPVNDKTVTSTPAGIGLIIIAASDD